jgi:hypothetical protein
MLVVFELVHHGADRGIHRLFWERRLDQLAQRFGRDAALVAPGGCLSRHGELAGGAAIHGEHRLEESKVHFRRLVVEGGDGQVFRL